MTRVVILQAANRGRFEICLEHWGAGIDFLQRRWVLIDRSWVCVDSGEAAMQVGSGWPRILGYRKAMPQIYGLLPI